jgi:type II secretory pathway pseudopilin PulG
MGNSMAFLTGTPRASRRIRIREDGYVLLAMLLVVALLAISAAVALPSISFTIRRDREQEMIHRGVQYSRAIRAYYKKFGRYPTRLEDLDNTNNLRFLRKRYKDPITGQDFRLLHYGEQGVTLAGGIAGGSIPGANPIGSPGGLNSPGGFSQPSAFGSQPSAFGGNSFGANSNAASGQNSSAANSTTATGPSQTSSPSDSQDSSSTRINSADSSDQSSDKQIVTGGPIVGVASTSKKNTIREFNKKKKYNEWQFIYDPTTDRGGLITTPNQPSLQGFAGQSLQPGQGMQPGNSTNSPFGQPSGFGNPSSPFGNNPNSNTPPVQPPSNPPQQQ